MCTFYIIVPRAVCTFYIIVPRAVCTAYIIAPRAVCTFYIIVPRAVCTFYIMAPRAVCTFYIIAPRAVCTFCIIVPRAVCTFYITVLKAVCPIVILVRDALQGVGVPLMPPISDSARAAAIYGMGCLIWGCHLHRPRKQPSRISWSFSRAAAASTFLVNQPLDLSGVARQVRDSPKGELMRYVSRSGVR